MFPLMEYYLLLFPTPRLLNCMTCVQLICFLIGNLYFFRAVLELFSGTNCWDKSKYARINPVLIRGIEYYILRVSKVSQHKYDPRQK